MDLKESVQPAEGEFNKLGLSFSSVWIQFLQDSWCVCCSKILGLWEAKEMEGSQGAGDGEGCIGKVTEVWPGPQPRGWTVQNCQSFMLMEKTWPSHSLKYRPTFLSPRALNCMFLSPRCLKLVYALSFRKLEAGHKELDFHLQVVASLNSDQGL